MGENGNIAPARYKLRWFTPVTEVDLCGKSMKHHSLQWLWGDCMIQVVPILAKSYNEIGQ